MAMTHFPDGAGGYTELAVVGADQVAPISVGTSFADAAATPLPGTAYSVLSRLALSPGSRLLILGASGGVGLFLLQLAPAGDKPPATTVQGCAGASHFGGQAPGRKDCARRSVAS
jgi:NADPH:quinone reductase-like Zn-dependent oxidoreductase